MATSTIQTSSRSRRLIRPLKFDASALDRILKKWDRERIPQEIKRQILTMLTGDEPGVSDYDESIAADIAADYLRNWKIAHFAKLHNIENVAKYIDAIDHDPENRFIILLYRSRSMEEYLVVAYDVTQAITGVSKPINIAARGNLINEDYYRYIMPLDEFWTYAEREKDIHIPASIIESCYWIYKASVMRTSASGYDISPETCHSIMGVIELAKNGWRIGPYNFKPILYDLSAFELRKIGMEIYERGSTDNHHIIIRDWRATIHEDPVTIVNDFTTEIF